MLLELLLFPTAMMPPTVSVIRRGGGHAAPCATELSEIKGKARAFSQLLIDDRNITKYDVHGLFGIFANGDAVAGKPKLRYFRDYEDVKISFMHAHACRLGQRTWRPTVCEVGFNAGLSALLLLESVPNGVVLSFDLGDMPWARAADRLLHNAYGARFPGVVWGDAKHTVQDMAVKRPSTCDIAFLDGDKSYKGRYSTLWALSGASRPNALVFMDEVSSEACVNGTFASGAEHAERCTKFGQYPPVRAYNDAVREGWFRVERCAWPRKHPHDGICLGRFQSVKKTRYL